MYFFYYLFICEKHPSSPVGSPNKQRLRAFSCCYLIIFLCRSIILVSLLSIMALTHTLHPKPTISVVIKPFHYCPSSSSLPLYSRKFQNGEIFLGTTFSRIQTYHNPLPALTRRLFLPSVSGLWDALTSGNSARDAVMAIRKGMQLFRQVIILDFSFTLLIAFLLVQLI